ncbi:28S ribosomal protein S23, mitochondrial [Ischnura elegans]|uniref:28S ribosomal protein S23, mitochondrial n=1 Tax=Ischnura elegans TaxID=197161 RepID=UPI001ED88B5A|nr:28S ribosomal protein S23, mitochondrial [Ischnura elegans]
MAWSRLEKVGTIFSRVNGLIRAGALKEEDTPLWFEFYKRFPPLDEPKFDRPAKDVTVRKIFYPEDVVRAKFYKKHGEYVRENLADHAAVTKCQHFIEIHGSLKDQGTLEETEIFDKAAEMLGLKSASEIKGMDESAGDSKDGVYKETVVSSFRRAQERQVDGGGRALPEGGGINVKDLFKE